MCAFAAARPASSTLRYGSYTDTHGEQIFTKAL